MAIFSKIKVRKNPLFCFRAFYGCSALCIGSFFAVCILIYCATCISWFRILQLPSFDVVNYRSWKEQKIIEKLLDKSVYDKNIRPQMGNDTENIPVYVTTSILMSSLSAVKEITMEFKAQFRFQQEWDDPRLRFNDTYFNESEFIHLSLNQNKEIWYPDTFFQNEKTARYHSFDQENVFFMVNSFGRVMYNRRLTMTFACTMKLKKYPLDSQICYIDYASYAYTTNDIIYLWNDKPLDIGQQSMRALSNFKVENYFNASCTSQTATGTYSCLRVVLHLRRVFSFFLLQLYIPSTLLVAVSWVSYWIDWRAAAGRVPLAIVTLLAMITQSHAINANLPPVSYAKAIDIWVGACVMFIFGSLIEYAFVNFTGISDQKKKAEIEEKKIETQAALWQPQQEQLQSPPEVIASPASMGDTSTLVRRRGSPTRRRRPNPYFNFGQAPSSTTSTPMAANPTAAENIPLNGFRTDLAVQFEDISDRMRLRKRRRFMLLPRLCRNVQMKSRADQIDFVSRFLFPCLFISFNFVYWSVYWGDWNEEPE